MEILKATHVYLTAGTYTVSLTVIDRAGGANTLLTSSSANQPAIGGAAKTMKMCRNGTSVTVFANGVQNTALNATTAPIFKAPSSAWRTYHQRTGRAEY
jgi:PKD repeat protein